MKWGRLWGTLKKEKGFTNYSLWGGDYNSGDIPISGRQIIRHIRGRIIPCESCKRISNCAMYHSVTRNRLRHGEYSQGTNILHMCDIYISNKSPSSHGNKTPQIHGRTSGKQPT